MPRLKTPSFQMPVTVAVASHSVGFSKRQASVFFKPYNLFDPLVDQKTISVNGKLNSSVGRACRMPKLIKQVEGSNPLGSFQFFSIFFQTLRAYNSFAQNFAKMGPFPRYSIGLRELLDISLIHVLSRALCVSLVWKIAIFRSKNGRFMPFSYS